MTSDAAINRADDPDSSWLDPNGLPIWIGDLGLECYTISVARDLDPPEALARLGFAAQRFRPVVLRDLERVDDQHSVLWGLMDDGEAGPVAARFGDWTLVIEEDGWVESSTIGVLSEGSEVASCYLDVEADPGFTYAVDGKVLVNVEDLVADGCEPARLAAVLAAVNVQDENDLGLPERAVCALAGLRLSGADFRGRPLLVAPRG